MKPEQSKTLNQPVSTNKATERSAKEAAANRETGVPGEESQYWEAQEDRSDRGRGEWKEQRDASARGAGDLEQHDLPSKRGAGGWDGLTR